MRSRAEPCGEALDHMWQKTPASRSQFQYKLQVCRLHEFSKLVCPRLFITLTTIACSSSSSKPQACGVHTFSQLVCPRLSITLSLPSFGSTRGKRLRPVGLSFDTGKECGVVNLSSGNLLGTHAMATARIRLR